MLLRPSPSLVGGLGHIHRVIGSGSPDADLLLAALDAARYPAQGAAVVISAEAKWAVVAIAVATDILLIVTRGIRG
jgi:hypothetical protein